MTVSSQALCPVGWLKIEPEHPSLAGHFPGQPVLPGVVLLELVLDHIRESLDQDAIIQGIPRVKFLNPVLPGQQIMVGVEAVSPQQVHFVCHGNGRVAVEGVLRLALPATP